MQKKERKKERKTSVNQIRVALCNSIDDDEGDFPSAFWGGMF
jgi:hypothetical protein